MKTIKTMKTMKATVRSVILVISMISVFTSCSDDDDNPTVINEEETITTVKLTVTESGSATSVVYTWEEDNVEDISLNANSSYNIQIEFLDESDPSDVEDITEEVIEEKDEHFVFYETTVSGLTFVNAADDTIDSDDIGINISTDWSVGDAADGVLRAYLIHEPTSKTGDVRADFGGETDIEVTFNVSVE